MCPSLYQILEVIQLHRKSPVQVERSDRPVQGSADDDEAAGGEGDIGDAAGVFCEGDEAKATVGVPHFDLWKWNYCQKLHRSQH